MSQNTWYSEEALHAIITEIFYNEEEMAKFQKRREEQMEKAKKKAGAA